MIHIGNQTTAWAPPAEPFEYALAHGFDAFEWFPDKKPDAGWDERDLDASMRRAIRETARAHGVRLSVHARLQANPAVSGPALLEDFDLARDLGAALLNVHLYHEAGLAAFVEALTPLLERAAEARLQVAIENTPEHPPELFNELFARLRELDTDLANQVGLCLDVGHANLCAATRNDYLAYLDRLAPHVPIIHLHLHENWGDADSHLPLFAGPASRDDAGIRGLVARLQHRQFSGSIILEQWPHPPSLLDEARDKLLRLFAEAGRVRDERGASERESVGDTPTLSRSNAPRSDAPRSDAPHAPRSDDFVHQLVAGNPRRQSWREKLDFVRELLDTQTAPLTVEQLADVAIYLRFLGAGQVPCVEDGRHFRPAHHARTALRIQERLAGLPAPEAQWIARKIYLWLPSSARTFRRAEPLTRIRDIAHRNDIPADLKREIKHTLQNKLHRCAGPEDLATSARLLERVTAPGADYAPAFVEQFGIFHEELKEFFNARSLDERLSALLPLADARLAGLIQAFREQKSRTGQAVQLAALKSLTRLRRALLELVKEKHSTEAQEFLLAEITLEDFAFVLLSQLLNAFPAAPPPRAWGPRLAALQLTVTNLALSRIAPAECRALEAELRAGSEHFDPADREQCLRLKAGVERGRRLAQDYSDRILALFPPRVAQLGRALGVAEEAIRVFCEAEIRGHLVFQLAKLVSMLLRDLRAALALPAWDVLVTGHAVGCLTPADSLADLDPAPSAPVIALLKHAEGDEEIPKGITGIVLAHEIPHLSHLGVRARQAGVVFVTWEEGPEKLQPLAGKMVSLEATTEKVACQAISKAITRGNSLSASSLPDGRGSVRRPRSLQPTEPRPSGSVPMSEPANTSTKIHHSVLPAIQLTPDRPWLPLEAVTLENSGGKAHGARRLAELARQAQSGFVAPPGLAIPFGVMEAALHAAPGLEADYRRLLNLLDKLPPAEAAAPAERLRDLIHQLSVPGEIAAAAAKLLGPNSRLMVRSSANCEDLEEMAGAGLYESVANVLPADVASALRTVWASLWTPRATLARRQAGIPHAQAHMAVLIQPLLAPDYAFILHTVNPINHNPREVYAELAVGLGETLAAAAARGTPYRFVCDKASGAVTVLAFANFSQALRADPAGGMNSQTVDYSQCELTCDAQARTRLGRRLADIARALEQAFQKPQDVEGAVIGSEIHLVQARAQQGLYDSTQGRRI